LAHVTLWTDWGIPTFTFDVYLEGRDSVEVDLRLLFRGIVPQSGPGRTTLGNESDSSVSFPDDRRGIVDNKISAGNERPFFGPARRKQRQLEKGFETVGKGHRSAPSALERRKNTLKRRCATSWAQVVLLAAW
jgi:hypothetical protein